MVLESHGKASCWCQACFLGGPFSSQGFVQVRPLPTHFLALRWVVFAVAAGLLNPKLLPDRPRPARAGRGQSEQKQPTDESQAIERAGLGYRKRPIAPYPGPRQLRTT